MSDAPIQGVIFDLDGVLCDSEPYIIQAAMQMFAESYNVTLKPDDFKPFTGMGEERFIGGPAEQRGLRLALARDKRRTYEIYLRMIKGSLQPLPGAVEVIKALRARAIRVGVASSADRVKVDGNLAQLGLPAESFDAVVSGNDVTNKKPAPDIFRTAAARLRLDPAHALVVEDAPAGVQAALACGARCLAITTSFDPATLRAAGAHWTAPDLTHLPAGIPWA